MSSTRPTDDQCILLVEDSAGENRYERWDGGPSPWFDVQGAARVRIVQMGAGAPGQAQPGPAAVRVSGLRLRLLIGNDGGVQLAECRPEVPDVVPGRQITLLPSLAGCIAGALEALALEIRKGPTLQAAPPKEVA